MERKQVEIFIAIDSDGEWSAGSDADDAHANLDDACGNRNRRCLKFTIDCPFPPDDATTEVEVKVPEQPEEPPTVTVTQDAAS